MTGWLSYALAATSYRDRQHNVAFVSDFDQRHTLNAFASYRLRPTVTMSAAWRYGSGQPIPGFIETRGTSHVLSEKRNTARLPKYSRLDARVNKTFLFRRWRLSLAGEVLNILNRRNIFAVSTDPIRVFSSGRYSSGVEDSFGVLPALAITFDF